MEKEIKIRKKRFAAFWTAAVLVCSMVVPMLANALDDNGIVTLNEMLDPWESIRAGEIIYQDSTGATLDQYPEGSGGWQSVYDYIIFADLGEEYTFSGWKVTSVSDEKKDSGQEYGNVMYPVSVTLRAVLTPTPYTITYDLNGGEDPGNPASYTVETETFSLKEPTKNGYTFRGWICDGQTEPTKTVTIAKGTKGALAYTADWSINQYTITFDTAGGSEIVPITQGYGTAITAPGDPTRENHYFMGWDTAIPDTMPAENLTITAKWTPYVIDAGTYELKRGVEYKLGNATKVSGDSSIYASGSIFYVPADGSYTFS